MAWTRQWADCIRSGCVGRRQRGWPLCWPCFDQLPSVSRNAWKAARALAVHRDSTRAMHHWMLRYYELEGRRVPLGEMEIEAWQPAPPVGKGQAMGHGRPAA